MTRFLLALMLVAMLPLAVFGQGNAAALAIRNSAERAAGEASNQWRDAHKLFVVPSLRDQASPHATEQCMVASELVSGRVGLVDCWPLRVIQVLDQTHLLLGNETLLLRLDGFETRGLQPQQPVRLLGPVRIDQQLPANALPGERRPVFVIRFVTPEESATQPNNRGQAATGKPAIGGETNSEEGYSVWHSTAGTEVKAKFVGYSQGKVELLTVDGRTLRLPFSVFTDADAKRLRELARAARP